MKFLFLLLISVSFLFSSVDINKANIKELISLKGIGKLKAKAIIEYRAKHCFVNIDDLANVKGIGKKVIENNRDNLTFTKCKK